MDRTTPLTAMKAWRCGRWRLHVHRKAEFLRMSIPGVVPGEAGVVLQQQGPRLWRAEAGSLAKRLVCKLNLPDWSNSRAFGLLLGLKEAHSR